MNTSKLAIFAATLSLGLGASFANAGNLNIDSLVYKTPAATSASPKMVEKGPVQLEIDTLNFKPSTTGSKTRAEVRSEIAMSAKSKVFTF
jgi:hypothetical protein